MRVQVRRVDELGRTKADTMDTTPGSHTQKSILVIGLTALIGFGAGRLTSSIQGPSGPRITGIGGIFFKSEDPKELKAWYAEHFGMPTNEYGAMFEFREGADPRSIGYLQWSPFSQKTTYFAPSEKPFMINYRVKGIEALVDELKASGATVTDSIATYEYGKFVHVMDPEGNKLELWEPMDSVFTNLYEGTTVK